MKSNKSAFSLIELSVVLCIIIFLVTLARTTFHAYDHWLVRMELEQLKSLFFSLRQQAIITQKPLTLMFDVSKHAYTYNNQEHTLSPRVHFGVAPGVKGPPSHAVTLISNPITFEDNKVLFSPDAKITSGTVYITDTGHSISCALTCPVGDISYIRCYVYEHTSSWSLLS